MRRPARAGFPSQEGWQRAAVHFPQQNRPGGARLRAVPRQTGRRRSDRVAGRSPRRRRCAAVSADSSQQACSIERIDELHHQRHCAKAGRGRRDLWAHRPFRTGGDGARSCRLRRQHRRSRDRGALEVPQHGGSLRRPPGGGQRRHRQIPPKSRIGRQEAGGVLRASPSPFPGRSEQVRGSGHPLRQPPRGGAKRRRQMPPTTGSAGVHKNCPFLRRGSLWGIASPRSSVGEFRRGKFARGSIRGGERLKIRPESGDFGGLGGRKESGRGDCSFWKFQRVLGAISTTAINESRRFAVPPVQSANFASASVAVSGERPREDLGLNARSEGEELSDKDGDERANALRRWLRYPRRSARIQVHGVGWHARAGGEWKGNCIIFSRQMQTRAGAIESVRF